MRLFSYTVVRDYGFAPNPFGGCCTLATCKPEIRHRAVPGDWIIGTGSKRAGLKGRLLFAMRVNEKCNFDEYWNNPRFATKKPVFNSSLKHCFGDNVYHHDAGTGDWLQEDSHHSLEGGGINWQNLNRDTRRPFVLISDYYWYFGSRHVAIPNEWVEAVCHNYVGQRTIEGPVATGFINWLELQPRVKGAPLEFQRGFVRYRG